MSLAYQNDSEAIYWLDGTPASLASAGGIAAMAVSGTDVYATGADDYLPQGGALWKNGLVTPLLAAVPGAITFPTALFLSGQDVYVAGQYRDPVTELPVATYWKNGTPVTVGVSTYSELTSIWVQGSEVYLAGVDGACQYWKNDQITPLQSASGGPYPDAIAVTASGDVLVAGQDWDANGTSVAVLWTNGVPAFLPDTAQGSVATSLAVAGGTIVVGGMVSNGSADVATVWKNGVRTTLGAATTDSHVWSVALDGSDVYAAGDSGDRAAYWKNTTLVTLATQDSELNAICLVRP